MKRNIVLILFFALSFSSFAHRTSFYAIDGSEWHSEKDRDAREKVLWNEVFLHMNYIKKQQLVETDLIDTYLQLTELYKELFFGCREVNSLLRDAINNGGDELELIKSKVIIDSARAINKEMFYTKDLKITFDLSLDMFDFFQSTQKVPRS